MLYAGPGGHANCLAFGTVEILPNSVMFLSRGSSADVELRVWVYAGYTVQSLRTGLLVFWNRHAG